jgi:hypothetical protein
MKEGIKNDNFTAFRQIGDLTQGAIHLKVEKKLRELRPLVCLLLFPTLTLSLPVRAHLAD